MSTELRSVVSRSSFLARPFSNGYEGSSMMARDNR
jgi:hypothetical protein